MGYIEGAGCQALRQKDCAATELGRRGAELLLCAMQSISDTSVCAKQPNPQYNRHKVTNPCCP